MNEKYQALSSNDKDYLQRLLNYRIEQDKCQKKIEDTYNIRASFHQNDTPPPDLDPLHQDIIATLGMDLILEYAVRYKAEGGTVVSELVKLYKDQTQHCPVTTIYTSDIRDWLETIEWL